MLIAVLFSFAVMAITLALYAHLHERQRLIMTDQATHAAELAAIETQLTKASGEIVAKIAALADALAAAGGTTPEVDAAVADLKAVAQAPDDLNPDPAPA